MTSLLHLREPSLRLLSLDVVRGITIAFMIMVNTNGGGARLASCLFL
jgi:predicted acyltransferase